LARGVYRKRGVGQTGAAKVVKTNRRALSAWGSNCVENGRRKTGNDLGNQGGKKGALTEIQMKCEKYGVPETG